MSEMSLCEDQAKRNRRSLLLSCIAFGCLLMVGLGNLVMALTQPEPTSGAQLALIGGGVIALVGLIACLVLLSRDRRRSSPPQ